MKAEVEVYRGIEFVRLSALSREQAKAIRESSFGKRVIKILHGSEILPDCLPWTSYLEWYDLNFLTESHSDSGTAHQPEALKASIH